MKRFFRRSFCGKLLLDLAHLRQAKDVAHARWARPVFCGQIYADRDDDGPDASDERGTAQLRLG